MTGDYCFCKLCRPADGQPQESELAHVVKDKKRPVSLEYEGCVLCQTSTSGMLNHMRRFHPQKLAEGAPADRGGSGQGPMRVR